MILKPAMLVTLKSTGQQMTTISEVQENGEIWCEWRNAGSVARAEWYSAESLDLVESEV